tara:strand:+ start:299 stop:568 length:270 start_codon:yes stop_codon:yes gene_type:complete
MKKYTFIVPMDVKYNFYAENVKSALNLLLMNHNVAIKGEIESDPHKIDGTEDYRGSTIIEEDGSNEKGFYMKNGEVIEIKNNQERNRRV